MLWGKPWAVIAKRFEQSKGRCLPIALLNLSFSIGAEMPNTALNVVPFGRWTLRDKAAQRPLAVRWAAIR